MKNLKTVFLLFASLFLFFSCANDFEGGSAYVRIDPSIFNRSADDGGYSYVVAIMGEGMEPVWKSGSSGSSLTLEFTDLPVGEKAFVYASLEPTTGYQGYYAACSDDFIIKRGIQSVKLKLNAYDYSSGMTGRPFYFDCAEDTTNKRTVALQWNAPTGVYGLKRVSFTVSNGTTSYDRNTYVAENSVVLYFSLDYPRYTISNLKVEYFGASGDSWSYKVYQSPDSIIYEQKANQYNFVEFVPITQFSF